ncbi:MAG: glycosyl transferase [Lentisphaerae bacterium]|jgi:hypothetical protein|nr:glycosyl transferase [Lentisphaerota bacterium]
MDRAVQLSKLIRYAKNPLLLFWRLGLDGHFKFIPDRRYLEICFRIKVGHRLNLEAPQTFNEKLQWLKLFDRRPEYTRLADKLAVRDYIQSRVGADHLIPLLGTWGSAADINFSTLPSQFVLKCTHDSGSVIICRDKSNLRENRVRARLANRLSKNYYWAGREWPYRNIPPRVIAEAYMTDESATELKDYKFHCFNGEPRVIQVDFDRFTAHRRNLYDLNWNRLPLALAYPDAPERVIPKPPNLEQALDLVRAIVPPAPTVRVDLYLTQDQIYFGEFTFFHEGGLGRFKPARYDAEFGSWIHLPPPSGHRSASA